MESGCDVEQQSIDSADLVGDVVREEGWASGGVYPDNVTPFADYLCKFAEDLKIEGIVDFSPAQRAAYISEVGFDTIWGAEPYHVCERELAELTAGSLLARWALVRGDVQLSRVPKELLEPTAKVERVRWLESHAGDETRKHCDKWEEAWRRVDQVSVSVGALDEASLGEGEAR